jgi:hypothetical protein
MTGGCVRTTKLPTKEVAYMSRKDARLKSFCRNPLGYPRAIRVNRNWHLNGIGAYSSFPFHCYSHPKSGPSLWC